MTAGTFHHQQEESDLLLRFDRPKVEHSVKSRLSKPPRHSSNEYDHPSYKFSLGNEALNRLKDHSTGASLSAQHYHEMPSAWSCALALDANWVGLEDAWLARLVQVGVVMRWHEVN